MATADSVADADAVAAGASGVQCKCVRRDNRSVEMTGRDAS